MWWITCSLKSCKHRRHLNHIDTNLVFHLKSSADSPSASRQQTGWGAEKRRSPSPGCSTSTETAAWTAWTQDRTVMWPYDGCCHAPSRERNTYLFWESCPHLPQVIQPRFLQAKAGQQSQTWPVWLSGRSESQRMLREAAIGPCSLQPNYTHSKEPNQRGRKNEVCTRQGNGGCTAENLTPGKKKKPATKGGKLAELLTSYRATAP